MALRFCDSFGHYNAAQAIRKWLSTAGTVTISNTGGRFSTGSGKANFNGTAASLGKTLDNQASWVVGFALRVNSSGSNTIVLVALLDGTQFQVELRLTSEGHLYVTRNNTTIAAINYAIVLEQDIWYYIEFKATIS